MLQFTNLENDQIFEIKQFEKLKNKFHNLENWKKI